MAQRITLQHPNGLVERAYVGWSWTSFFFGGMPALFRGDALGFSIWAASFIVCLLIGMPFLIAQCIGWAVIYNRWHSRRLIEKGYKVVQSDFGISEANEKVYGSIRSVGSRVDPKF